MADMLGFPKKIWRSLLGCYYNALHDKKTMEAYKRFLYRLPLQNNKIVMDNYEGRAYGESPKYVAEELLKRDPRYRIIWLTFNTDSPFPKGITPVYKDSFRAYYECATAKAWVFNTRCGKLLEKRAGQVFLQTWHGGVALKKVEKDAMPALTDGYIKAAQYDGQAADGIIVDGKLNEELFETSFWLSPNCERLKFGMPRIDVLIQEQNNQELKRKVRKELGIADDSFFVLYAPTFRKKDTFEGYITDFSKIREAFEERFGKVEIAVRLHPNDVRLLARYRESYASSLVDATKYPDVQELVLAADCVITDYSSIAYDFAIIRKPVFLLMTDAETYKNERGVYDTFYDQPFTMNYNEDMLIEEIRGFSAEDYRRRVDRFYEKYPTFNDGHAAEKSVDWLIEKGVRAT